MKQDIKDRKDIQVLIDTFYDKVRKDETIGFIFNEVAKVDWVGHLPIMYDFWEGVLFKTHHYTGNPMEIHRQLNQRVPFTRAHFDRWLELFLGTVDEHFEGEKAELARQRAQSIATMIRIKITSAA